jgi:hypothetical protein
MKKMQPLKINLLLILILCTSIRRVDLMFRNNPLLTIQAKKWQVITQDKGFFINAIITNNSKDTFYYVVPTCMAQCIYKVDSKDFYIEQENLCYKYSEETIKIAPFQSVEDRLEICPLKPIFQLRSVKFRIGLDVRKPENSSLLTINDSPNQTIWSNIIEFN